MSFSHDVVIVGGCGRVGLPLGLAFAERGLGVVLFDVNEGAVAQVTAGVMPFDEPGAPEVLAKTIGKNLTATCDPSTLSWAENVVVVIGTPVDEHLNPDPQAVPDAIEHLAAHLVDGQSLILRSTLYPGVTALVARTIDRLGLDVDVAFCPERIAEGKAMTELYDLPQIVSGTSAMAEQRATKLFRNLTAETVTLSPEEAELAKLFTNTWRYIKFAISNQLYMIANDRGLDFERIRAGLAHDYPRAADLPQAGFAAGPCLLKDTMQLASFNDNNFVLGHSAMMVNEGLPLYLVSRIESRFDLSSMTVAILGMAFKGESDDIRSSLSYKLRRILRFKAKQVLCADPFVGGDDSLLAEDEAIARADLVVIGAPHLRYRDVEIDVPVIDVWGLRGQGVRV